MKRATILVLPLLLAAQADKPADIKKVMARLNKPTGIYFSLVRELKDQDPAWDEARTQAQELSQLAGSLARSTPPKGDKASWDRQIKTYIDNAKAADAAVRKKDKAAAQSALAKMGEPTCMNCHKAHRP